MNHLQVTFFEFQCRNPIQKFLRTVTVKQETKITKLIECLEKYGVTRMNPYIRKLTGTPLWEARILGKDNIRFFFVHVKGVHVIILHAFFKKTEKTMLKEIHLAMKRYALILTKF